jgi:hypothetical protein
MAQFRIWRRRVWDMGYGKEKDMGRRRIWEGEGSAEGETRIRRDLRLPEVDDAGDIKAWSRSPVGHSGLARLQDRNKIFTSNKSTKSELLVIPLWVDFYMQIQL